MDLVPSGEEPKTEPIPKQIRIEGFWHPNKDEKIHEITFSFPGEREITIKSKGFLSARGYRDLETGAMVFVSYFLTANGMVIKVKKVFIQTAVPMGYRGGMRDIFYDCQQGITDVQIIGSNRKIELSEQSEQKNPQELKAMLVYEPKVLIK